MKRLKVYKCPSCLTVWSTGMDGTPTREDMLNPKKRHCFQCAGFKHLGS